MSLDKIVRASTQYASRDGRDAIHLDFLGLTLDDSPIVGKPLGLAGDHLKAEVHAVSTDTATLAPLDAVIKRCYLAPVYVPSALASGLAVTRADERGIGVTVVDIGAGNTTLAHCSGGRFVATGVIATGGRHITQEVAHRLQTSLAEAERIKTLYGSLIAAPSNELERVSYPTELDGDLQMVSVSRAEIRRILEPRTEALMRQVAEWRAYCGAGAAEAGCVVLTGGGSLLVGIGSFAADRLGVPVRVGEPTAETGAPGNVRIAGYATALGLVAAARLGRRETEAVGPNAVLGSEYLGRVSDWLKRNF
jgi:cell division protein FtsA